jgi:AcrR family transcriptional regulator
MDTPVKTKSYHHGDLRQAMLDEAARMIEQQGLEGLSLRAMARAVGVTHAAPANHFGDLTGLLSELAAEGYRRFAAGLVAAIEAAGTDTTARGRAMAHTYVGFARDSPGLFTLMFRSGRLDAERPALKDAIAVARQVLQSAVAEQGGGAASPLAATAQATARWALVHGYAVLLLEGRLKGALAALPQDIAEAGLFDAVLDSIIFENKEMGA